MVSHLRKEIENIVWSTRDGASDEGWTLHRSEWKFSYSLCPGVTLWVRPCFAYRELQGLVCSSQPDAIITSDLFAKAFKFVFGKAGNGPAATHLVGGQNPKRVQFDSLRNAFAKWPPRFVDIDYPCATPAAGFYPTEILPTYLSELRKATFGIVIEDYVTKSEQHFLNGLPKEIDIAEIGLRYTSPKGPFTAYALTQLLCGNTGVIEEIARSGVDLYPVEVEALSLIKQALPAVLSLAQARI